MMAAEPKFDLTTLSVATLAAHQSAAIAAQQAALETGRDDLYEATVEVARLYRLEVQRRTDLALAAGQDALDRLNADLRGVSIADIRAERGA